LLIARRRSAGVDFGVNLEVMGMAPALMRALHPANDRRACQ
jgi:hypothetical protein